jgi:tripartite-type tricarboxylate transporter receptor subunit TctC
VGKKKMEGREMNIRRQTLATLLGLAALALSVLCGVAAAQADDYPNRPIKVIVPYPPGSSGDIVARLLGQRLSEKLGQPVVIDDRPGGSGIVAERVVTAAAPDGYTLILDGLNHVTNAGLFASMPFDTEKDFTPVSIVGSVDLVLVAHPSTGFKKAADLIKAAKEKPGTINFASAGNGTGGHLAMELFAKTAGISLVHIPYRGATPALQDVLAGHVQILFTGVPPTLSFIKSGKLNPLVVAGATRTASLPDVPTAQEIGMAGFNVDVWFGVLGPGKMPKPVTDKLAKNIIEIVHEPDFRAHLAEQGITPNGNTSADFAKVIHQDLEKWTKFIRELGIKAN